MTIEQAIKKAIEGGYKREPMPLYYEKQNDPVYDWTVIFWDASFWQSLGKAMWWGATGQNGAGTPQIKHLEIWAIEWHRFIDHLIEGKKAEEFFKKL